MSSGGFSIAVSAGTATVQGKQVRVAAGDSLAPTRGTQAWGGQPQASQEVVPGVGTQRKAFAPFC